ncbi:hypothetical protein OG756_24250 [Streptomyces sp. NBC_01310]|uniref:hypothetical protein n=1 Tax=Streptomyces sp. NBC_01310 TaxID=2903820 RepID=UPI0035B6AAEE|nr:hypothetical protein OG756_24250 [Streptomyces sp. NBC_01310]
MNKVKLASMLGVAIAAGSLITAPTASAAQSAPSAVNCKTWSSGKTGYVKCTGMIPIIERVRVNVTCIDSRGSKAVVHGSGKGNGDTSSASCPDNPNVGLYEVGYNRWRVDGSWAPAE